MKDQAALVGVKNTAPLKDLPELLKEANKREGKFILFRHTVAKPIFSSETC